MGADSYLIFKCLPFLHGTKQKPYPRPCPISIEPQAPVNMEMEPKVGRNPYICRPITEDLLRRIYESDQDMYPAPLEFKRLRSWVEAAPEMSIAFYERPQGWVGKMGEEGDTGSEEDDKNRMLEDLVLVGVIIVLPLERRFWEDLLVGKLKEIDIGVEHMIAGSYPTSAETVTSMRQPLMLGKIQQVGMHVFHVEKFETPKRTTETLAAIPATTAPGTGTTSATMTTTAVPDDKGGASIPTPKVGFAQIAIDEILKRAESKVVDERRIWSSVFGLSALTATEAGKKIFARMGFTPTGYKEMFVTTRNPNGDGIDIRMVYEYPKADTTGNNSEGGAKGGHLGSIGGADGGLRIDAAVSEASEMVVKYKYL